MEQVNEGFVKDEDSSSSLSSYIENHIEKEVVMEEKQEEDRQETADLGTVFFEGKNEDWKIRLESSRDDRKILSESSLSVDYPNNAFFRGWTQTRKRRFSVNYEYLVWFLFWVFLILGVLDRFFESGDAIHGRSGKKPCCSTWGTNVGETITNVLWAITARVMIVAQNLMFWSVLWCIPNLMFEYAPRWFKIYGIRDIHIRMHRWTGVFLIGVPAVLHVWIIFVPPLIDRVPMTLTLPSDYNYSSHSDGLNWTTFWDPAAYSPWSFNDPTGVHLTTDEIFRLLLMTVIFLFLVPLSMSTWLNERSYSIAMIIHVFAAVAFAADNLRKKTHQLSHLVNLPILILWALDRLLASTVYLKDQAEIVRHQVIGMTEYVIMYVKMKKKVKPGVGDIYYLLQGNRTKYGLPQRSHPFTVFSNHSSKDSSWDIGYVISVQPDNKSWFANWTRGLADLEGSKGLQANQSLQSWGPYRSSHWHLYRQLVQKEPERGSYYLFATGSGFGYIMDALGILAYRHHPSRQEISTFQIHFSVRCKEFVEYISDQVDALMKVIEDKGTAHVVFYAYVTNDENLDTSDWNGRSRIRVKKGRFNAEKILKDADKHSIVYYDGSSVMTKKFVKICDNLGLRLVKDFANARGSDKKKFAIYVKSIIYAVTITVGFCLLLHIYIRVEDIFKKIH